MSGVMSRIPTMHKKMRKKYTIRKEEAKTHGSKVASHFYWAVMGSMVGTVGKVGTEIYMGRMHALAHKRRLERCIGLCANYTITERG